MLRSCIIIFCFFLPIFLFAGKPYFHQVVAQKGDNIHRLLKRYKLHTANCNFEKFYELNKLNSESELLAQRRYFIPVLIYDYNGKSINTTLKLNSWKKALEIKNYNDYVLSKKFRKYTVTDSNILWVPYHQLGCKSNVKPKKNNKTPAVDKIASPKKNRQKKNEQVDELAESLKDQAIADSEKKKEERKTKNKKISQSKLTSTNNISGYRKFPIFGKKYAYIPQLDNQLRGKVFYIVSGHGGVDSGAFGKYGKHYLYEDEYAYDVALRLVRYLLSHGALAYMITRDPNDGMRDEEILKNDQDEYCWGNYKIPASQKTRLYQRSDAINTLYEKHLKQGIKDQTTVCIHIDSRSKAHNTDVFFYYFPGSQKGKKLAKKLHSTFKTKYKKYRSDGNYHGTISGRDLHMLREVKPNTVFIELGNIKNSYDQQRFLKASNRDALAKWLYEGLAKK